MAAAAAEIFINCLRQRRRRLENLSKFSVIGSGGWIFYEQISGGGGSAARLTPLFPLNGWTIYSRITSRL
jgi:hypothetical protein